MTNWLQASGKWTPFSASGDKFADVWKEPKLPPAEKMPRPRENKRPSVLGRGLAGLAGCVLGFSAARTIQQAMGDGQSSPFMGLALLLPTIILIRYAMTGVIKAN